MDTRTGAGSDKGVPSALPGEVLTPVIKGDADPGRKNALIEIDSLKRSTGPIQMRMLVTNDYKLVYYPALRETMLFDRRSDPRELRNIALDPLYQPMVSDMLKHLLTELARTEIPVRYQRTEA